MIVPGPYQVGPNYGASENLRPRALHRYRWKSPFSAVGVLQYSQKPDFLQDGHRAPAISPMADSRSHAKKFLQFD